MCRLMIPPSRHLPDRPLFNFTFQRAPMMLGKKDTHKNEHNYVSNRTIFLAISKIFRQQTIRSQ